MLSRALAWFPIIDTINTNDKVQCAPEQAAAPHFSLLDKTIKAQL
jgi:hypothetical protein